MPGVGTGTSAPAVPARSARAGSLVLVCDYAAPHAGNFIPSQCAVAAAANRRLHLDTTLIFPAEARERHWIRDIDADAVRVEFLPPDLRHRPAALVDLARRVRARILHSHFVAFDLDCWYAAKRTGASVVWHLHNGLIEYPIAHRLRDALKVRIVGRRCDMVLACSSATHRDALRRGFAPASTHIVPNGIALDRFEHAATPRHDLRSRLGIDDDTFVALAFGSPVHRKGVDVLVDAVTRLHQRLPVDRRLALVIVGGDDVRALVRRAFGGIPPWIVLLEPVSDVASLFGAADVFVSAAREEGFPIAIGEAMASGLPVVGSSIPGTLHYWSAPAYIRYGVDDPAALADRVDELLRSPERHSLGSENRTWAHAELAVERYAERTVDMYERLVESRHTHSLR